MSKIKPGSLQNLNQLIIQATVTEADVNRAINQWSENPPDEKYSTILKAEIIDD